MVKLSLQNIETLVSDMTRDRPLRPPLSEISYKVAFTAEGDEVHMVGACGTKEAHALIGSKWLTRDPHRRMVDEVSSAIDSIEKLLFPPPPPKPPKGWRIFGRRPARLA